MEWKCDRGSKKEKELYDKQKLKEKFHDDPERSKREDSHCINCFELEKACGNCFSEDGTCFKCGRLVRCGALNSEETH